MKPSKIRSNSPKPKILKPKQWRRFSNWIISVKNSINEQPNSSTYWISASQSKLIGAENSNSQKNSSGKRSIQNVAFLKVPKNIESSIIDQCLVIITGGSPNQSEWWIILRGIVKELISSTMNWESRKSTYCIIDLKRPPYSQLSSTSFGRLPLVMSRPSGERKWGRLSKRVRWSCLPPAAQKTIHEAFQAVHNGRGIVLAKRLV